ncbi:C40 family peptidase [Streptomyces sp. NPDC012888]|uniref:C40 family peptidase n=1 Tax=Streptomyces sp. NPDC012888 TaxID=3364855 RepID=UPI0036BEC9D0
MSHTAHIPSHRKPRRSASKLAVRAGVAGGVLSTLAMAGTASATPVEPVTETLEMPVLNMDLGSEVSSAVTTAADNSRAAAVEGELNAQEENARTGAAAEAKKAKEEAQKKADAEKKAKEEAERKAAAERASRNDGRSSLSSKSTSDEGGSTSDDSANDSVATGSAAAIVSFARAQVGKAYVMGATGPSAYDCSGLVRAAYKQANISLPRMSQDQSLQGTKVSLSNLQPGDILYWGSRGSAYHVAIYVGGGKFVGAQNPSTGIVERSLSYDMPTGAVRIL